MKNLEPYVEIQIISEEPKIYKWLKIASNTARTSESPGAYYKINGNEFLKILEHHKQSVIDCYNACLSTNDMLDLCYIKIIIEDKLYEFSFNYENNDLLNFANVLYRDLKNLIEFYYLDYDDVEWNIVKEIKALPLKTKFVFNDYFKKYGIIGKDDKDLLFKRIYNQIIDLVKFNKKPFKSLYLCETVRI